MAGNGWKVLKMAEMADMAGNGWKLLEMVGNDWKWLAWLRNLIGLNG